MKTVFSLITVVMGLAFLSGCATPETRIKQNPEAFNRLTPGQQELVKAGRVDVGFDMDAVKLALGDPDRIYERTDEHGKSEIWNYINYRSADGVMLYRGFYHRYWGYGGAFPYYADYDSRQEYDRTKVTFRDGKVISAEQEVKG